MRITLLIFFTCVTYFSRAQRIENIRAEVVGDSEKVVVTYDINGAADGQKFKVTIYSSHNNFSAPLSLVTGDVGSDREITAGSNKRIEWSARNELKEFSGDVTFEIRAEIATSLFIQSPVAGKTLKKGKTLDVTWQGGTPGESMRLDLVKGGSVITQIASIQNNQKYTWVIPKTLEKGADYQVKLTASSGSATSGNFKIKKKTSFLVYALPVVVVGGAVVLLSGGKESIKNLPEPPNPQ